MLLKLSTWITEGPGWSKAVFLWMGQGVTPGIPAGTCEPRYAFLALFADSKEIFSLKPFFFFFKLFPCVGCQSVRGNIEYKALA